jgi:hypothetical protein
MHNVKRVGRRMIIPLLAAAFLTASLLTGSDPRVADAQAAPAISQVSVFSHAEDVPQARDRRQGPARPANSRRLIVEQPFLVWQFRGAGADDRQDRWQIQVSSARNFAGEMLWDSGEQQGDANHAQIGVGERELRLQHGTTYYTRVKAWNTAGTATHWFTAVLQRNNPPHAVRGETMSPNAGTTTTQPLLQWQIEDEPDGDAQMFEVVLTGAGATHTVLSREKYVWFEFAGPGGVDWRPFAGQGVQRGARHVRLNWPQELALAPGRWSWTVVVNDGFEAAHASAEAAFTVGGGSALTGRVLDLTGKPVPSQTVSVTRVSDGGRLGAAATGADGAFSVAVELRLNKGDMLLFSTPGDGAGHFRAAAFVPFGGSDMAGDRVPSRRVTLEEQTVTLDTRNPELLRLGVFAPPEGAGDAWPLLRQGARTQLGEGFTRLKVDGGLRLGGYRDREGAPESESLILSASAGTSALVIATGAEVFVGEGSELDTHTIMGEGDRRSSGGTLRLAGILRLRGNSRVPLQGFELIGGLLELHSATLELANANVQLTHGAEIRGVRGDEVLRLASGTLSASGPRSPNERFTLDVPGARKTFWEGPWADQVDGPHSATFNHVALSIAHEVRALQLLDVRFTGGPMDNRIEWNSRQRGRVESCVFEPGATHSVRAGAEAGPLMMLGCGGAGAGPATTVDPRGVVRWEAARLEQVRAHGGDGRALIQWLPWAQRGEGFRHEVHRGTEERGEFSRIATTDNPWYVDEGLTNGETYFYIVRVIAWGGEGKDSERVRARPLSPELSSAVPTVMAPTSALVGMVSADCTHFTRATTVRCDTEGVSIPEDKVEVDGESLLTFHIATKDVPEGKITIVIETPGLWAAFGVRGYTERLTFDVEIRVMYGPHTPSITFIQDGGAVGEKTRTEGAFTVSVKFHRNGGAPITLDTFDCVVERDILVAGKTVAANQSLAHLWTVTPEGATWRVNQNKSPDDPKNVFITPGELLISVRVGNEYRYIAQWESVNVYVEGNDPGLAYASDVLWQGEDNQKITITCNQLGDADWIWFPDQDIKVVAVTRNPEKSCLEVTVNVGMNAAEGRRQFEVGVNATRTVTSRGTYQVMRDEYGWRERR